MSASSDSNEENLVQSERTLAIIKPEAYDNAEDIENIIIDNGFHILAKRQVHLTAEQAAELYRGHYGRQHFPHLVAHISSGPIIALVLASRNAIRKWRTLMGPARVMEAQAYWPDSIRACYGRRTNYGEYFNAVHGSENHAEALREIHFFFPNSWYSKALQTLYVYNLLMIVGPVLRQWQVSDYIGRLLSPTLGPALTALARERPAEPLLWLADRLARHNPNQPQQAPQPAETKEERRCHTPVPSEESFVKPG